MAAAADHTASASRRHLSVTSTPPPLSKDVLGSINPIPLSPQWLLQRPRENKPGLGIGENNWNTNPNNGIGSDTTKLQGIGEETPNIQKKDVFRPSVLDMETGGRRDRWRDEERDTNSSIRKDRGIDGGNDFGDTRKIDRWTENVSSRQFGEARRATSERKTDSSNREVNYEQRRDSKWNTSWGPEEKEKESLHEKWVDSVRNRDMPSEKGVSHLTTPVKDETGGDHYRPWRSNASQSRGRGEPPHHQTLTPNKHGPMFPYGRGRGENSSTTFSLGRGRVHSSGGSGNSFSTPTQFLGTKSEKSEIVYGDPSLLRYSRTKLLDVYRTMDMRSSLEMLGGFVQVASLTQEEPLEPVTLSAPTPGESVILKGIDKGDIVSSDAPQITKEGSVGRNTFDFFQSRGSKLGSKEDFADHFNEEGAENSKRGSSNNLDSSLSEGGYQIHPDNQFNTEVLREDRTPYRKAYEVPAKRESSMEDNSSAPVSTPWRSTSIAERSYDVRSSTSEMSWSQPQKYSNERQGNVANLSHPKNDMKWHVSEDSVIKKLPPGIPYKDHEFTKVVPPPPEDLVLFYKDPQGEIQGPFSGIDVIGWFEAGYFGIDLQVCMAGELNNSSFSSLGEVMPHLCAKSRPPPGFSSPKQNEITDASSKPSFGSFGKLHGGSSNADIANSEPIHLHGSAKQAENRFLESLMSANINSSPLEKFGFPQGLQGYIGNNSSGVPPVGLESDESVYLMAKKLEFERQKSLLSHYPYQPQLPNGSVNNSVTSWSNFPIHGGMESFQDKVGLYHGQSSPLPSAFGIQQHLLQQQNQSSLTSLLAQTMDNASGLPQDPQLLNMLQQQYLLQLHSQTAVPTQQLSVLDKLLLLKQQQEQQQKLMLQQQLLSQVLSEQHAAQCIGDPSHGQLPATAISAGNASGGGMPPSQEFFQDGSDLPVTNRQDQRNIDYSNLSPQVSQETNLSFETTLHLPHQMFGDEPSKQSSGPVVTDKTIINQHLEPLFLPINDGVKSLEVMDWSSQVPPIMHKGSPTSDYSSLALNEPFKKSSMINDSSTAWETRETLNSVPQLTTDVKVKLDGSFEEKHDVTSTAIDEPSLTTSLESVEVHEMRKASDKKSRKQKASKAKDVSKTPLQQDKLIKTEDTNVGNSVFETQFGIGKAFYESSPQNATDTNFGTRTVEALDSQSAKRSLPASLTGDDVEFLDMKASSSVAESVPQLEKQGQTVQRAWKPAPGFKAKSLLEIQQEEQRKAQMDTVVYENTSSSNPMNLSAPWAGVMSRADIKSSTGVHQDAEVTELVWGMSNSSLNSVSKKSQLHNLLAEEVLAKSKEKDLEVLDKTFSLSLQPAAVTHLDSIDNENFIEAKDSKKNRKKSAKAKGGAKAPVTVDLSLGTSPVDKGKTRHGQQEKEVLPAVPSGPSFGDFVIWKGGESPNTVPAPAWSNDSGKLPKPTSLRDILKEQGKKVSSPQKSQPVQTTHGNGTSFSLHGSSPSKAASPIQINLHASAHLKFKGGDDLFWGASDQPKQEAKQVDFPQLASQSSRGTKNTPVKGTPGRSSSQQKSFSGRPTEHSFSSSPTSAQSSMKGKRDTMNKYSEAMDFRDWCASETVRLTGTKDTSFLEFCLKQSQSEAEILLRENLGLFDPEHEFIDKFLNYKELLPADVLEIAFQNQMERTGTGFSVGDVTSDNTGSVDLYLDTKTGTSVSTKDGGKKKGKKGKKVSPSVLGFNVVSNRIMMGEIQTLDD